MKKHMSTIAILFAVIFLLAACGSQQSGNQSKGDNAGSNYELIRPGTLTLVSTGGYKPFNYMENGEMVGYDIAVGKEIAKILGLELKLEKAEFQGHIIGIQEGRYDIAIASHTITQERKKQVNFSQPYYYSGPMIFSRPDTGIKSAEDLKGKKVAFDRSTVYREYAKMYTDKFDFYDDDLRALQAVADGHGDAGITDEIMGKTSIENGLKLIAGDRLDTTEQAIVIKKGNDKLLEAINDALAQLKSSGKLKELSLEWLGIDITQPE
ncbi:transporter substrate-binding domain-containing protein [Bacillus sp. FJAT-49705]|uniref:Transporter substrate-binding domain-containing protein n=1 Tax=Cytobacillus citreus TaxID=2833586 RepID=A0ABS5NZX1_9BACI|nr:transporter substrate-binding domain-containing protein [Cytobacillus citreus]MBS4192944.1 transporter substrate-binding domain-containing protein [Cytobacillus citreus]